MLHEVLRQVFGGRPVTVAPLPGGLTNQNYRVEAGDESFVVRIAGAGTELLGIDRDREEACSRAAARIGIGPAVVAYLPEHHALVTRFLTGTLLTEESARRLEVLRRVADTVRRCHAAPVSEALGRFSVFDTVRAYERISRERGARQEGDTLSHHMAGLSWIEGEVRGDEPPCLCHNDLLPSNLIDDDTAVWLIDWEYAGVGDRFFDLGNLAVNLQLDHEQESALLEAYFGEARPHDLYRLRLMRAASDLRESAWGYLQAAVSKLNSPEYYLAYAEKYLTRYCAYTLS
jgi:thiamine kinase-like enzyme